MCNIDFYSGQYTIWKVQRQSILRLAYDAVQGITAHYCELIRYFQLIDRCEKWSTAVSVHVIWDFTNNEACTGHIHLKIKKA